MSKEIKRWVKIKGDKTSYRVTHIKQGVEVSCYDKKTGANMEFNWDMVEKIYPTKPKFK